MTSENRPLVANLKHEALLASLAGLGATILFGIVLTAIGSAQEAVAVAAAICCLFLAYVMRFLPEHPHPSLGMANRVTIFRCALVANCAALSLQAGVLEAQGWLVAGLMLFTLSLDGVDGWLARRLATASRFGARFDQELDAFFTLILSVALVVGGKAGPWILLAGLWHYFFLGLRAAFPSFREELPPAQRRKTICVVNIAALILCVTPAIQPPLSQGIAGLAVLLLSASFLTDIVWLAGRRVHRTPIA
jgi:phosphatidylglycerophosphate synthase